MTRDPWQHGECGRLFCEDCLNEYGKKKPCPNCRMEPPSYFKDNRSEYEMEYRAFLIIIGKRDVKALRVTCDKVVGKELLVH